MILPLGARVFVAAMVVAQKASGKKGRSPGSDNSSSVLFYSLSGSSLSLSDLAAAAGDSADDATSSQSTAVSAPRESLYAAALSRIPYAKDADGEILTDAFVEICALTTPLIDSFGPAFSMVRNDINRNCQRLRNRKATDPVRFGHLYPIVEDEVARHDDNHSQSCTKAVLWLKRGMEFMLAIMARLRECPDAPMSAVVGDMYNATLHRWHGWVASSAFTVALKFVPNRQQFLDRMAGGKFTPAAAEEMDRFVAEFSALLSEVHAWLDAHGLDDPAKV